MLKQKEKIRKVCGQNKEINSIFERKKNFKLLKVLKKLWAGG
jgi:hypothetical protein